MLQNSSRRKRPERLLHEDTGLQPKKLKLCNQARPASSASSASSASPEHYLDTLSKIWLTSEALRELDRRTGRNRPDQPRRLETRRPLTRALHTGLQGKIRSTQTSASEFLQQCPRETLKELKLFAKHGGPDLLDVRGYPEPVHPSRYTMSSAQSSRRHKRGNGKKGRNHGSVSSSRTPATSATSTITKATQSSGSYNPNFHQRMIDNGIYPYGYEYPDGRVPPEPDNLDEIQQMMMERRPSLSPSVFPEETFKEFRRADAQVTSENKATQKVIPMIQGTIRDERCADGPDIRFANLANLLTGKDHKAKPDLWYGTRPEQVDPRIRDNEELGTFIVPSTTTSRPCAPNLFVETKGPKGSNAVALDQACFDGAIGARAIYKLQTYRQEVPTCDNNAYVLTYVYHAGTLKTFTHHLGQPNGPGSQPECYMNQVGAYAMTHNRDTAVQGMAAFRNGERWAEAQRNAAIDHANTVANAVGDDDEEIEPMPSSFTSQSPFSGRRTAPRTRRESDTSTDELAPDFQPSKQHSRRTEPSKKEAR